MTRSEEVERDEKDGKAVLTRSEEMERDSSHGSLPIRRNISSPSRPSARAVGNEGLMARVSSLPMSSFRRTRLDPKILEEEETHILNRLNDEIPDGEVQSFPPKNSKLLLTY